MEEKLKDPKNGLRGYVELQNWIETEFKKEVKYNTLLKYSIENFGSSVKVARKSHIKKDDEAVNCFKNFSQNCKEIYIKKAKDHQKINLYFQDESRFGLFTKNPMALTAKGVKPICLF